MDGFAAASQPPSPEAVMEEAPSPLDAALLSWESNGDFSDDCNRALGRSTLSSRRPRSDDGSADVPSALISESPSSCTRRSPNQGNLSVIFPRPSIVTRQEPGIYSGSSGHRMRASFRVAEKDTRSGSKVFHDSEGIIVNSYSTRSVENTCLSPKGLLSNERGDREKMAAQAHRNEVFKGGVGGHLVGQGEVLKLGATTAFPVRQVSFTKCQVINFDRYDTKRSSRRGDNAGRPRFQRHLSKAAKREKEQTGPPNVRLVHGVVDNLIEEFDPRPLVPGPSRQASSPHPPRPSVRSRRRRPLGMALSSPLIGRRRGADTDKKKTRPPNMCLVHGVVDNLIEEFESRPLLPRPSRQASSPSPPRSTFPSRRRRPLGIALSTPLLGRRRGAQLSSSFRATTISPSTARCARRVTSSPDDAADTSNVIDRVWTTCSKLESVTEEVKTEARRLHRSLSQLPASNCKNKTVSVTVVSHNESEDRSVNILLDERTTPARDNNDVWVPPTGRRLSPVKAVTRSTIWPSLKAADPIRETLAAKGSKKGRAWESKAATDHGDAQQADAKRGPFGNISSKSPLGDDDVVPIKGNKHHPGKQATERNNVKEVVYEPLQSQTKAPVGKEAKKALRSPRKEATKGSGRGLEPVTVLHPETDYEVSVESNKAATLNDLVDESPLSPGRPASAKEQVKATSGKLKASGEDRNRRVNSAKPFPREPSSTDSIDSDDAAPPKMSTARKNKKEKAELTPTMPEKSTGKKKSGTVPFWGRERAKEEDTTYLNVDEAKADDAQFSDEASVESEDQTTDRVNTTDRVSKRPTSLKSDARSSRKEVIQIKKQLPPEATEKQKKIAEQEPRGGTYRGRKAVFPGKASGRTKASDAEATGRVVDKEMERPKWRDRTAYEEKPEGENLKLQAAERGEENLGYSVQRELGREPRNLKPQPIRAQMDAVAHLKAPSEITNYQNFSTESSMSEDNEFLMRPPKLHENERFEHDQGGMLSSITPERKMLLVEQGPVYEGMAYRKSSFPINDRNAIKRTKRRRWTGMYDQPDCEVDGQYVAGALISRPNSPHRSALHVEQDGSDPPMQGFRDSVVFASPSFNYGKNRQSTSVSVEFHVPQNWSFEHHVPERRQVPSKRVVQLGPPPFLGPKRAPRSESIQWISRNTGPPLNAQTRYRMGRTMLQGPPARALPLFRQKQLPMSRFPAPSVMPRHVPTAGFDQTESFYVSRRMQPLWVFYQQPCFYKKRFCTPERTDFVASLNGGSHTAMPLSSPGPATKPPEMFRGAFIPNTASTNALFPNGPVVFRGNSLEFPSGPLNSATTAAELNLRINLPPLEAVSTQGAASEPTKPHATGQSADNQARPARSIQSKEHCRSPSADVFYPVSYSEQRRTISSKGSASSGLQIELTSERNSANLRASRSTNSIISTGEQRLHEEFGHKFHQPASIILYAVLGVVAFVAIAAGITSYLGRYVASSLLYDITDSGGDIVGSHSGPRVLSPTFKKGTSVSPRKECRNPWCSEQMVALIRSLDASVRPCQDFYGHVCPQHRVRNSKAAKLLTQPTEERMMSFLQGIGKAGREAHVVRASARLWQDCVDLANLKRLGNVPLQDLLNLTGLGGWPYRMDDALPDVWVAAGKLQRLMELAPLVEVNVRADNTLRLSHSYRNGSVSADDVLTAMLTMRQNWTWLRPLAEDVAALWYKMDGLLQSQEPLVPHHQLSDADSVLRPFLQVALEGVRPDAGVVRTEMDNLIDPLLQLVGETRPNTVLNLIGYRIVRHVGLFIPTAVKADIKSGALYIRRSSCTRVVLEDALTADAAEYVRYAALRSQLDFRAILSVEKHLKRVLHAKLAGLAWMDHQTRQRAQQRLRDMKVRFSDDRNEGSSGRTPVRLPEALPSQALATYQRFREARFRSRMLRVDAVQDNRTDPDCTHDGGNNVLHLRLSSALEGRDPRNPLWPVLQAARLAPILSRCMLRVLLPPVSPPPRKTQSRGNHVAPSAGFKRYLACLRAQDTRGTSASTGSGRRMLGAIYSAALEPARRAYDEYVVRLARKTPLEQLMGRRVPRASLEWNQTFYVAYARSMCKSRHRHGLKEPQLPPRELVNGPLSNDRGFHKAFHCLRGEPMRPDPTCRFWDDSPNDT